MEVAQSGGIFASRTLPRDSAEAEELRQIHARVLKEFGFRHGVIHMEFIRASEDGRLYFMETAARVGGAYIYDLVEAATGVNLWAEWAKIEMSQGARPYQLPPARHTAGSSWRWLARSNPTPRPSAIRRSSSASISRVTSASCSAPIRPRASSRCWKATKRASPPTIWLRFRPSRLYARASIHPQARLDPAVAYPVAEVDDKADGQPNDEPQPGVGRQAGHQQ